jgi:uncharacterized protein
LRKPSDLRIDVAPHGATSAVVYPADPSRGTLVLAHGTGAGQRSPFMISTARAISAQGFDVVTFDFLYVEQRRRVPDKNPVLEASYLAVIHAVGDAVDSAKRALFIGGKSMGGRIATQAAAAHHDVNLAGIVLLGYPLHPPGRPDQRRDAHLPEVRRPMLFVQGSRDAFGTPAELSPIVERLGPSAVLHVVDGGDHSFKVSRSGQPAQAAVYDDIHRTVVDWMGAISGKSAPARRHSA